MTVELTPEGQRIASDLAARWGFSQDAVIHTMVAVLEGNGTMAQFNHPELGGNGQWMQGGMLMLGDMFNHALKGRVDGLCNEIAGLLQREPGLLRTGSFQSQRQSGGGQQQQSGGPFGGAPPSPGQTGGASLFVPDRSRSWWPAELGTPTATGSQNNMQYAYFADARRLAVSTSGDVWVYDTQDHKIGGFSQQQGMGGSILFQSQYGIVDLSTLPVLVRHGQPAQSSSSSQPVAASGDAGSGSAPAPKSEQDIFAAIERLGDLRSKGILTEEEFQKKKAELLARI